MNTLQKGSMSERIFSVLKNALLFLLIINFVPSVISNIRTAVSESFFPKTSIGYLTVDTEITNASFYVKKIEAFAKDPEIKGLLLRIDCPGGYAGACYVIYNELKKLSEKKPIVALIENVGASGGYQIASAAQMIIANPMSLVGSIGNFMELPNVKGLLATWNIDYRYVQSGTYKTTGSAVKDLMAHEQAYLQALSDNQYQQFIHDIARERKLLITESKIWADGKSFTGNQALDLRLIDKLGSWTDAVVEIKRLAHVEDAEEVRLVHAKKATKWMQFLGYTDEDDNDGSLSSSVATFLNSVYSKCVIAQATTGVRIQ